MQTVQEPLPPLTRLWRHRRANGIPEPINCANPSGRALWLALREGHGGQRLQGEGDTVGIAQLGEDGHALGAEGNGSINLGGIERHRAKVPQRTRDPGSVPDLTRARQALLVQIRRPLCLPRCLGDDGEVGEHGRLSLR